MPITVKACISCMSDVKKKLDGLGIPYTTSRNTLTVNCTSPSQWGKQSLAAMCWRGLEFSHHAATRNGNTIKCSRA
ncbi:hypothetical protein N658DRAFT_508877 [Parathielavia hyrcaniae]|uniref:Uncharacterized protein n=1 Tax=Parathielavia hyrcaniae TaxID=113614 RepID=A0AAN6Q1E3_9PEZI|nr:hypothetical protein N658DRAFT_508877 [Parathielavia hyrcaniae]